MRQRSAVSATRTVSTGCTTVSGKGQDHEISPVKETKRPGDDYSSLWIRVTEFMRVHADMKGPAQEPSDHVSLKYDDDLRSLRSAIVCSVRERRRGCVYTGIYEPRTKPTAVKTARPLAGTSSTFELKNDAARSFRPPSLALRAATGLRPTTAGRASAAGTVVERPVVDPYARHSPGG